MSTLTKPGVYIETLSKNDYSYDIFLNLKTGCLYKTIQFIEHFGFRFVGSPPPASIINLELGEILLFTGKSEFVEQASYGQKWIEKRYYFINKTSLIFVRSGWVTTKYLEQIDLCNKTNNNLTKQTPEII